MNFHQILLELEITSQRSRGPGGQHVNKTESAALLKWNYLDSLGLNAFEKLRVQAKLGGLINKENQIVIRSDEFRELERNKARGKEKLLAYLRSALHQPKKRIATKPTRSSRERRLESKSRRARTKAMRKRDYE